MTSSSPQSPLVTASQIPPSPAAPPGARNTLALVSCIAALCVPVEALLIFLAVRSHSQALLMLAGSLGVLALPATVIALITGHVALRQAKRYTLGHAWRRFAIFGLVIGYLTAAVALLTMAAFIIGSIFLSQQPAPVATP